MPVAGAHDPGVLRALLEPWMQMQLDTDSQVIITDIEVPQANGFSNETFLLKAQWDEAGKTVAADLVLRSQAEAHQVFPVVDLLNQQHRTMKLLGEHTSVPVPRVRWAEADASVLGQPFFLMDRLYGEVPGDNPPYMRESFVTAMSVEDRLAWSSSGVDVLTQVAAVDWRTIGFDYLDMSEFGAIGPEQRQGFMRHFYQWTLQGNTHPVIDPAFRWLEAHWPDDGEYLHLNWGDARPGNQMYSGTDVIGVFDWEMVSLGNAESDLGWWLFLQRFSSEGMGVELPEGVLDRAQTITRWEGSLGRPASQVEFYERLAAFQFMMIFVKLSEALNLGMEVDNPVANLAKGMFRE